MAGDKYNQFLHYYRSVLFICHQGLDCRAKAKTEVLEAKIMLKAMVSVLEDPRGQGLVLESREHISELLVWLW